jgi:hypothetical protein
VINIQVPKIEALHRTSINQNRDIISLGSSDFDEMVVIYGDHALK